MPARCIKDWIHIWLETPCASAPAVRQAAQAGAGPEDGAAAAADEEEAEVGLNVDAALALQQEELLALEGGQLRLPFSDAVPLQKAVRSDDALAAAGHVPEIKRWL